MLDIAQDFPMLRNLRSENCRFVYLDNAATTQKPDCVINALTEWYCWRNANPHRGTYNLSKAATELYEKSRRVVADHIGADVGEIIFCRNTTEAINLVAQSFALNKITEGDEIVLPISEHHSNLLPWQKIARERKARLVYLLTDRYGRLTDAELDKKIGSHTKIVACAMVSNVLGTWFPLKKIIDKAHSVGAFTVIDCAQGLLHGSVNPYEMGADFLAFSSHKAFGPNGIGILWGRKKYLEEMTPFLRGGEMVTAVTERKAIFEQAPLKFEAGTQDPAGAYAFAAALDYIENLGIEKIRAHEAVLTQQLLEGLRRISGLKIYGNPDYADDRGGIVSFNIAGQSPLAVAFYLDHSGITIRAGTHCAQPLLTYLGAAATCRVSLSPYNTEEEIAYFLDCLAKVPETIAGTTLKGR